MSRTFRITLKVEELELPLVPGSLIHPSPLLIDHADILRLDFDYRDQLYSARRGLSEQVIACGDTPARVLWEVLAPVLGVKENHTDADSG